MGFKILWSQLNNEYRPLNLTATYEAVTTRVLGRSFALTTCRVYRELLAASRATWQPIFHSLPQSADGSTSPVAEGTSQSLARVAFASPPPPSLSPPLSSSSSHFISESHVPLLS